MPIGNTKKVKWFKNITGKNSQQGFTIVELVVVLALFVIIIDVTVTIFISMVKNQKRVLEDQEFLNQTSYAAEYISRAVRTALRDGSGTCLTNGQTQYPGYNYLLTRYNAASGFYEGIKLITDDHICTEFYTDAQGVLQEKRGSASPVPILSGKFTVQNMRLVVNGNKSLLGASKTDGVQPRVTMMLTLQAHAIGQQQQQRIIQTTLSQRNLNTNP